MIIIWSFDHNLIILWSYLSFFDQLNHCSHCRPLQAINITVSGGNTDDEVADNGDDHHNHHHHDHQHNHYSGCGRGAWYYSRGRRAKGEYCQKCQYWYLLNSFQRLTVIVSWAWFTSLFWCPTKLFVVTLGWRRLLGFTSKL